MLRGALERPLGDNHASCAAYAVFILVPPFEVVLPLSMNTAAFHGTFIGWLVFHVYQGLPR